jgi:surfeit locus 1 family protein
VSPRHRAVSGRLDTLPEPGVRVGTAGVPGDRNWPRVLNFPRQQDVEQALGERVESRIVLLDPAEPDGYERVWRPAMRFGPERHLGYAIQWFALALAVLVAFVALSLRRRDDAADTTTMDATP